MVWLAATLVVVITTRPFFDISAADTPLLVPEHQQEPEPQQMPMEAPPILLQSIKFLQQVKEKEANQTATITQLRSELISLQQRRQDLIQRTNQINTMASQRNKVELKKLASRLQQSLDAEKQSRKKYNDRIPQSHLKHETHVTKSELQSEVDAAVQNAKDYLRNWISRIATEEISKQQFVDPNVDPSVYQVHEVKQTPPSCLSEVSQQQGYEFLCNRFPHFVLFSPFIVTNTFSTFASSLFSPFHPFQGRSIQHGCIRYSFLCSWDLHSWIIQHYSC